jgi:hypothetical protein
MNEPGYAALKERTEWVKQYGLRRKLQNAANRHPHPASVRWRTGSRVRKALK